MRAAKLKESAMQATDWPGSLGRVCSVNGGSAKAKELHESQCEPDGATSPLSAAVLTRQTPPNLPVRTSSANVTAGAINAANTATKLKKAAMRFHKGRVDGDDDLLNTDEL